MHHTATFHHACPWAANVRPPSLPSRTRGALSQTSTTHWPNPPPSLLPSFLHALVAPHRGRRWWMCTMQPRAPPLHAVPSTCPAVLCALHVRRSVEGDLFGSGSFFGRWGALHFMGALCPTPNGIHHTEAGTPSAQVLGPEMEWTGAASTPTPKNAPHSRPHARMPPPPLPTAFLVPYPPTSAKTAPTAARKTAPTTASPTAASAAAPMAAPTATRRPPRLRLHPSPRRPFSNSVRVKLAKRPCPSAGVVWTSH